MPQSRQEALSNLEKMSDTGLRIRQLAEANKNIGVFSDSSYRIGKFCSSQGRADLYLMDDKERPIYFKDSIVHKVYLAKIPDLSDRVIELMESPFTRLQRLAPENRGFIAGQEHLDPDKVERMHEDAIRQIRQVFSGYKIR